MFLGKCKGTRKAWTLCMSHWLTYSGWSLYSSGQCPPFLPSPLAPGCCCAPWPPGAVVGPCGQMHWRCCSCGLLPPWPSTGYGWSRLQTRLLGTGVLLGCDLPGCCSSLEEAWGYHTRLGGQPAPSTLHCTCRMDRALCAYHNNPHAP